MHALELNKQVMSIAKRRLILSIPTVTILSVTISSIYFSTGGPSSPLYTDSDDTLWFSFNLCMHLFIYFIFVIAYQRPPAQKNIIQEPLAARVTVPTTVTFSPAVAVKSFTVAFHHSHNPSTFRSISLMHTAHCSHKTHCLFPYKGGIACFHCCPLYNKTLW